jgi:isopentenyldiphosphate isomerase
MVKIPHDPNEIIAVVNEKDKVVGSIKRGEVHKKGILHREVAIYFLNSKLKKVLLHKRSDNHLWDHSSAGHFPYNQDYLEAAQREFEEELGIKLDIKEFKELAYKKMTREIVPGIFNNRFVRVFVVKKEIPFEKFSPDLGEIEELKYFNKTELLKLLSQPNQITSCAKEIISDFILKFID